MAHTPIDSMQLEKNCQIKQISYKDQIKLELVDVVTNLDKYAKIHFIKSMPEEQLLNDLFYNFISFLMNKKY